MITINIYILLAIIQIVIVLFCLVFVFYKKSKKATAYSDISKSKKLIIKQFLSSEVKHTKRFINASIVKKNMLTEPYKSQLHLLKNRMQWLALEKSFLEVPKNKGKFWYSLIKHINELFSKWNITLKSNNTNTTYDEIDSSILTDSDTVEHYQDKNARHIALEKKHETLLSEIESLKRKDDFNKKKIRNLWNYKSAYQEVNEAYKQSQANYQQLRLTIKKLSLNKEQTKIIDPVLQSQSTDEQQLEDKITQLEKDNNRLQQELGQLEEIYNLHLQENPENQPHALDSPEQAVTEDNSEASAAPELAAQTSATNQIDEKTTEPDWDVENDPEFQFAEKGKTLTSDQDVVINEHLHLIEQLPVSDDEKTSLTNQMKTIQRNNFELMACYQVLSLDNERLVGDVETLKKQLVNVVKTKSNSNVA